MEIYDADRRIGMPKLKCGAARDLEMVRRRLGWSRAIPSGRQEERGCCRCEGLLCLGSGAKMARGALAPATIGVLRMTAARSEPEQ